MRPIKFRAWDATKKKMLFHLDTCGDTARFFDDLKQIHDGYGRMHLMQYTGLKDKNGKEIYEGDMLHSNLLNSTYEIKFGEYKDRDYATGFYGLPLDKHDLEIETSFGNDEIIGNIYETPELLKKEGVKYGKGI